MYEVRRSPPDRPWRRPSHYSTATYTPNGEYSAKPPPRDIMLIPIFDSVAVVWRYQSTLFSFAIDGCEKFRYIVKNNTKQYQTYIYWGNKHSSNG